MPQTIKLKRGAEADLPVLADGEPAFTTDSHELWIGLSGTNYQIGGSGSGTEGPAGPPGADGRDGLDGLDGAPGVAGTNGTNGTNGAPGLDGRDGVDGRDGAAGVAGADGADGAIGPTGPPGRDGRDGLDGLPGRDGIDGTTTTNVITTTLPGMPGMDGEPGPEGPPGPTGPTGMADPYYLYRTPLINGYIAESHASSAVTFSIKNSNGNNPTVAEPVKILFGGTSDDAPELLTLTGTTSLTVSSGSTLGATNGIPFRLWLVAFNDSGTLRLGVVNCRLVKSVYPLAENCIVSSTAEGGAGGADSVAIFYTGTAVSGLRYRILGCFEYDSGLATAGTWGVSPTHIHGFTPGMPRPGDVIQIQRTADGSYATGTTAIPIDNTTPQNTEGVQYLSQQITPNSSSNLLHIVCKWNGAVGAAGDFTTTALFQDSTANCLASSWAAQNVTPGAAGQEAGGIDWSLIAGTVSSTTFKIRIGTSSGANFYFNGLAGAGYLNGTLDSFLEVREIMA